MAKQQELEREKTQKQRDLVGVGGSFRLKDTKGPTSSTVGTKSTINPFELPLETFFDPIFHAESLRDKDEWILPLFCFGERLKAEFVMQSLEFVLVEPKANYTSKFVFVCNYYDCEMSYYQVKCLNP